MIDRSSEHDVELAVYADGRLELDMPLAQYDQLNLSAVARIGKTIVELAESNPSVAYKLIKAMVGSLAMNNLNFVSIDGRMVAESGREGREAVHAIARSVVTERMPEPYERPVRFSLGVYPSDEDKLLFGESIGDRIPVLDIDVQPPSYS